MRYTWTPSYAAHRVAAQTAADRSSLLPLSDERRGRVYMVEHRFPDADRAGRVYMVEHHFPDVPRAGRVYMVEHRFPEFVRAGRVYQMYHAFPSLPSGTGGGIPEGDGTDPVTGEEIVVTFARILEPIETSAFDYPRGKQSRAHTGGAQLRAGISAGRMWEEEYEPRLMRDQQMWAFLAYVNDLRSNERVFEIDYRGRDAAPFGTISGTATVSGANQTGTRIATAGWSGTLLRGDIIRIDGLNYTMDVVEDVTGPGTIKVNPGILVGGSPADGAVIHYGAAVKFRAVIDDVSRIPNADGDQILIGLRVRFREAP